MHKPFRTKNLIILSIFLSSFYLFYSYNQSHNVLVVDLINNSLNQPVKLPSCNPIFENITPYRVKLGEQIYPKRVSLHLNKSINFQCLNEKNSLKRILLWNPYFEDTFGYEPIKSFQENNCPAVKCHLTNDKKLLGEIDAVIVHGVKFGELPIIKNRPVNQRWIYTLYESPYHMREIGSAWAMPKLNGFFNLSSTYMYDTDFPNFYDIFTYWEYNRNFDETKDFLADKSGFAAAIVSNCGAGSKRIELLRELQSYIKLDIYGGCGHFKCPKGKKCRQYIASKYKFFFSFENSVCKDYLSEKFFYTLEYDIVPVVYSGADYSFYIPKTGYINLLDFKTTEQLATYLKEVAADSTKYNSYFSWKKHVKFLKKQSKSWTICDICIRLHLEDFFGIKYQTLNDLDSFFDVNKNCALNNTRFIKQIVSKEFSKQIYF